MKRALSPFAVAFVTLGLGFGCNAILGNEEGVLIGQGGAEDSGSGDEPEAGGDASADDDGADPSPEPAPSADPERDAEEPDPPTPTPSCRKDQKACDGRCVSLGDPTFGCASESCAACDLENAKTVCEGGECSISGCTALHADCNGKNADGCEADLTQPATCGKCKTVCPARAPACLPSKDGKTYTCQTGCPDTRPTLCGGACVDLQTDVNHCGSCDEACAPDPKGAATCKGGHCVRTCDPGFHRCDGKCVAPDDVTACGPACKACPELPNASAVCSDGACEFACLKGFADCDHRAENGCEAALDTDPNHCGTCTESCDGGVCEDGQCEAADAHVPPLFPF